MQEKRRRGGRWIARFIACVLAFGVGVGAAEAGSRAGAWQVAEAEGLLPPTPVDEPVEAGPAARPVRDEPAPEPRRPSEPSPALRTDTFARSMRDGLVIQGGTPHRMILFTFDDGPDHRYTQGLLDTLDALEIKAVFFLTARRFDGHTPRARLLADIARDIVRRGHFVGNHTMDHLALTSLDAAGLAEQVTEAEAIFERELGERPYLIRPPGGARSPRVDAWLAERGYTEVLWNIGSGDFQVREADDVVRTFSRVLERREREEGERGGIVLLHDIHRWSVEAFPRIVRMLEERNCELLADGDELYDFIDDPAVFFAARGEGGPSDEAPPAMPEPALLEERQARARARAEARCQQLAAR